MMTSPILLIIFNRPEITRKTLDAIRQVKPIKLYIAGDGPREGNFDDIKDCQETRSIINEINWPCEVKTLFQEKNLGCKYGPITALDWFFANVEEGIILEDDCLPDPTFFTFCKELLEKYREEEEIMHISGNNFQDGILRGDKESSYYFSKYTHSWGWATWRRAWNLFGPAIKDFKNFDEKKLIKDVTINRDAQNFWIKNFKQTIKGTDSWDSLWTYTVWYNNGLAILPQRNLVSNIGFGEDATHTKEKNLVMKTKTQPIERIIHPSKIKQDREADDFTFKTLFARSLLEKIISKTGQTIKTWIK